MAGKEWYREGLRFECTQCGNCCSGAPGYVWVTREEGEKIAAFLGLDVSTFYRRYVRRVGFRHSLIERADYDCIFLKRENGKAACTIYSVRPLQCRTWPYWNVNLRSPSAWEAASQDCPGMSCGEVQSFVRIERIRTAKKWADLT